MNSALIKEWMKINKIRPEQLAVNLGVSFSTVRAILSGKEPSRPTVIVLAGLMRVPEQELMIQPKKLIKVKRPQ